MDFVVDASVAIAWCIDSEATEYTESVLGLFGGREAVVPAIWPLEVANGLLAAERRKRVTMAQTTRGLDLLRPLPITVDNEASAEAWTSVLALARGLNLSAYDAAYLELALRRGLPMATLDRRLAAAAATVGVPSVGAREE